MNTKTKIYLLIFLSLSFQNAGASGNLKLNLTFPQSIQGDQIKLIVDNGLEQKFINFSFANNQIVINEPLLNEYSTVTILYFARDEKIFSHRFLIPVNTSSYVIFSEVGDTVKNKLIKYVFKNVVDVDHCKEFSDIARHCKIETANNIFLSDQYNLLRNDSILTAFNNSSVELALKQLEYVRLHGNKYYFFWFFRVNIVGNLLNTHKAELFEIFNAAFPRKYRESFEGKNLKALLEGSLYIKKGYPCPEFEATDYLGNTLSLNKFKGRYLILNFWASWCSPCIAEMPILRKIREEYTAEKLEIISVSYDRDSTLFIKGINSLQMNWINLFSNNNLRNLFGDKPIPAVYLIDPNGLILFSSWEDEVYKLPALIATRLKG